MTYTNDQLAKEITGYDETTTASGTRAALPEVLTVREAAHLLRVNRKTLYEDIRQGKIPGVRRIGGTIRVHRSSLLSWMANGQVPRSSRGPR
jgi:excisionase family DNA binding protein